MNNKNKNSSVRGWLGYPLNVSSLITDLPDYLKVEEISPKCVGFYFTSSITVCSWLLSRSNLDSLGVRLMKLAGTPVSLLLDKSRDSSLQ